jgi:hypothetical protein
VAGRRKPKMLETSGLPEPGVPPKSTIAFSAARHRVPGRRADPRKPRGHYDCSACPMAYSTALRASSARVLSVPPP